MLPQIAMLVLAGQATSYDLFWSSEFFERGIPLDPFHLTGSDGRQYTLETLLNGEPVLLFNLELDYADNWTDYAHRKLKGLEPPNRIADLNRLSRLTKGSMRVVGLTDGRAAQNRWLAKKYGIHFLLIGPDGTKEHELDSMELFDALQLDGGMFQGAIGNLQNAIILPNGKLMAIWPGYSRASLTQVQRIVRRYGGRPLSFPVSSFPRRRQVSHMGLYGEPGEGPGTITPEQGKSGAMAEWYERQERRKKSGH
ncbi:MAG TPA: hypothetical protein VHE55_05955 [Fimbriimonadaceae bacterium]|nr:hypothetical protein [Fimbriimonadaceae bacterium]